MAVSATFKFDPDSIGVLLSSMDAETAMESICGVAGSAVRRACHGALTDFPVPGGPSGGRGEPNRPGNQWHRPSDKFFSSTIHSKVFNDGGEIVGTVFTNSSFWHWVEYGSAKRGPLRPFARGFETTGLRLTGFGG